MDSLSKSVKKGAMETSKKRLRSKVSSKRWKTAQDSEREFWESYSTENIIGDFKKKAEVLVADWSEFIKIDKKTKILQVGCGPKDAINYFKVGKRYSIDPLAEFYKEKFDVDYKSSHLQEGRGEDIPFPNNYFDVIILANVLDHVESPEKVLSEIKRVLKDDGIFHFENFVYQKRFIQVAKIWGKIREVFSQEIFNIHHPYMFTAQDIQTLLAGRFLIIKENLGRFVSEDISGLSELKQKKRKSKRLTVKIPAMFGLYGIINYTIICKKQD